MSGKLEGYKQQYFRSINDTEGYFGEQASALLHWSRPWEAVLTGDFRHQNVRWFQGGELNAAQNCLDRHLPKRANQPAIIWESDDGQASRVLTYQALHDQVCQLANVLKELGVKKGDRVCIYLPMIPEAAIAMLATARLGAVHSVVFGGFSAEALRSRILDAGCEVVITADEGTRGGKRIALKEQVDLALSDCPLVKKVLVVQHAKTAVSMLPSRDGWYHDYMSKASIHCAAEPLSADHPLFILYTSGSTGQPKGILHGTGGYLLYAAMTYRDVFDHREGDIYWCTADVGWITGHTYGVYGPFLNGATTVMFEGMPTYPTPARCWELIDKYKVTVFYTAPTAIRALRREGDQWVTQTSRRSLRLLGSVGEPINPEAWEWYYTVVGESRCPIVDTWWQTETGGVMIVPLPGTSPLKPGSASYPYYGVVPDIVDEKGQPVADGSMGKLVITRPWPGIMQTIYGDHARFTETYFKEIPGVYLTGDQAYRDQDGYYWIAGRSDDVIKVSGHRIGTQEVESALIQHPAVSEAAVVAVPDEIKGNHIHAFVTLKTGTVITADLEQALKAEVRESIGAIAVPGCIQIVEGLPKTRSGKIMRRILRKIANQELDDLGDLSTLADASVVQTLVNQGKNNA